MQSLRHSTTPRPIGKRPAFSRRGCAQSCFALGSEVALWTFGRPKRLDSDCARRLWRAGSDSVAGSPAGRRGSQQLAAQRFTGAFSDRRILGILLTLDTLCLTAVLSLTGGPANPFTLLYLVQITLSAVILSKEWTWALGGLSVACFAFLFPVHTIVPVFEAHHTSQGFSVHLAGNVDCFCRCIPCDHGVHWQSIRGPSETRAGNPVSARSGGERRTVDFDCDLGSRSRPRTRDTTSEPSRLLPRTSSCMQPTFCGIGTWPRKRG